MNAQPVIYFDGICNLCTGTVQFVLKKDKKEIFQFASLQGVAGQNMLAQFGLPVEQYKTLVLVVDGKLYTKSTAALMIFRLLGGSWSALYGFIIIPRFIRDSVYELISRNRYKWFGKKEICWVPNSKWNKRFLE